MICRQLHYVHAYFDLDERKEKRKITILTTQPEL